MSRSNFMRYLLLQKLKYISFSEVTKIIKKTPFAGCKSFKKIYILIRIIVFIFSYLSFMYCILSKIIL